MSGDYLWDKSGQPDPAVERLENVLGVLGNPRPLDELQLSPAADFRNGGPTRSHLLRLQLHWLRC